MSRKPLLYPPYQKMTAFRLQSTVHENVQKALELIKTRADVLKQQYSQYQDIILLGPAAAPLARIKNQYRYHMIIKGSQSSVLNSFARQLLADEKWIPSKVKVIVDVDPVNLL